MSKTDQQGLYNLLTNVIKHSGEYSIMVLNFELNAPNKKVQFNNLYYLKLPVIYVDPKCNFHVEEKSLDYVQWAFNFVPKQQNKDLKEVTIASILPFLEIEDTDDLPKSNYNDSIIQANYYNDILNSICYMDLREELTLFNDDEINGLKIENGYSIIKFAANKTIFYTNCNQVSLSAREYLTTLLSINDKIIWYDFKSGDIGCSLLEVVNAKTLKTIMDNKSDNNIQNYCSKENCYNLHDLDDYIVTGWLEDSQRDSEIINIKEQSEIIELIKLYYYNSNNIVSLPFIGELYTFVDEDNNINISDDNEGL